MATKFLEPGGDADFAVTSTNGFWSSLSATPTLSSSIVHGVHLRSISYGTTNAVFTPLTSVADAGSRISLYIYINVLPSATSAIFTLKQSGNVFITTLAVTSTGILQLSNGLLGSQIGTNGATLSTGTWYRISLAYTITSTTVNRYELFVNSVSSISITNATLVNTGTSQMRLGNVSGNAQFDFYSSDHYIDNLSSLIDTGDIWVTAKRPFSNGTTNGFTTQIGSGGSGYGTGHTPQVNERPLSTTNGWSMVGAGSAITEEYNIEGISTGDMNLTGKSIVDYLGWVSASSLAGETASIIVNNVTSNISLTSTNTLFKTAFAGSASYPAATGTDIGIVTTTALTTVNLYECGILIAFLGPPVSSSVSPLSILGAG